MQTLTFSTTFDILDEIRTFVGNQAREAGFNAKDIYSVQLATDEAASNVIEHAYDGKPNGMFEVSCEFREDRLTHHFARSWQGIRSFPSGRTEFESRFIGSQDWRTWHLFDA